MANDFSKTETTGETPFRESETHNKCRSASIKGCEECIKEEEFCTISNNISNDSSFERNSWLLKLSCSYFFFMLRVMTYLTTLPIYKQSAFILNQIISSCKFAVFLAPFVFMFLEITKLLLNTQNQVYAKWPIKYKTKQVIKKFKHTWGQPVLEVISSTACKVL